jgi:transposase InsO family protein
VVAEVLADFRTAAASSPQRLAWPSVTELGLRHSIGRIGSCLDNAVAESFLTTLKASTSTASITAAVEGA